MARRKAYRTKNGKFVRGTFVKPRHFKKRLAIDLDFHTRTKRTKSGKLQGRFETKKTGERVPVIRTVSNGGIIVGRAKKMKSPYPKTYTIFTKEKQKTKSKVIPVKKW